MLKLLKLFKLRLKVVYLVTEKSPIFIFVEFVSFFCNSSSITTGDSQGYKFYKENFMIKKLCFSSKSIEFPTLFNSNRLSVSLGF